MTLFSKGERSGVEVRYSYYVGASLGITKPVYLEVIVPYDTIPYTTTKKYDPNDPLFTIRRIIASGYWSSSTLYKSMINSFH